MENNLISQDGEEWEQIIVDEIHESLCTTKGKIAAGKESEGFGKREIGGLDVSFWELRSKTWQGILWFAVVLFWVDRDSVA